LQDLQNRCDQDLLEGIGRFHAMTSALQRGLLSFIAEYDRRRLWQRDGCRHMGQWLAGHLGVTVSEGMRWAAAAHALEELPSIAAALEEGLMSFDKVLQLARFSTPETEKELLRWARRASVNAIRRKADLAHRPSLQESSEAVQDRDLGWSWYDDGSRLGIEGLLPADDGAVVIRPIQGLADKLPRVPDEEITFEQRCADALVALATAGTSDEPDARRATVVLNAPLGALTANATGCEIEAGPIIHPELARRLL
jgi:hypothetical protein